MAESTPQNVAETPQDPAAEVAPADGASSGLMPELLAALAAEPTAEQEDAFDDGPIGEQTDIDFSQLPAHARNLLQVQVPVTVALASQRKAIHEIVELGPGSIVKFDRTCDHPLELAVGDRLIALGEVVKVGDKFGLRIGRLLGPNASK
jgi:flagellar motor switch protein FliN